MNLPSISVAEYSIQFSSTIKGRDFVSKGPMPFIASIALSYNTQYLSENDVFEALHLMKIWVDSRWHNNTLLHCGYYFTEAQMHAIDMFDVEKRKPKKECEEFIAQMFNNKIPYLCKVEPSCHNMACQLWYYTDQMNIKSASLRAVKVIRCHEDYMVSASSYYTQSTPVLNPS